MNERPSARSAGSGGVLGGLKGMLTLRTHSMRSVPSTRMQIEVFSYPLNHSKTTWVCYDAAYDSELNHSARISSTIADNLKMDGGHSADDELGPTSPMSPSPVVMVSGFSQTVSANAQVIDNRIPDMMDISMLSMPVTFENDPLLATDENLELGDLRPAIICQDNAFDNTDSCEAESESSEPVESDDELDNSSSWCPSEDSNTSVLGRLFDIEPDTERDLHGFDEAHDQHNTPSLDNTDLSGKAQGKDVEIERGPSFSEWFKGPPDTVRTPGELLYPPLQPTKQWKYLDRRTRWLIEDVNRLPWMGVQREEDAAVEGMTLFTALGGVYYQGGFLIALKAAQPQRYTLSSKRACCIIEELPDNAEVDVKHTASHCGGLQSFEHCLRYDADTDDSNDDLTIRVGSLDVWVGSTKAAAAPPQCMNKKMVPAGWNHDQYLAYNIDVECGLEHWAVKQEKIAALESMNVYTFLKGAFVKQWSCESFQDMLFTKTKFRPLVIGYKPVYDDGRCMHEREEWDDVGPTCSSPHALPGAEADIADDDSVASNWEEYCDEVDELPAFDDEEK